MSFDSLSRILITIENQPGWEAQRQFRQVLRVWHEVVEEKYLPHSRPLYISRQVLWVATSSSVWAQNLTLKRYGLLKKLNGKLICVFPPLNGSRVNRSINQQCLPLLILGKVGKF